MAFPPFGFIKLYFIQYFRFVKPCFPLKNGFTVGKQITSNTSDYAIIIIESNPEHITYIEVKAV